MQFQKRLVSGLSMICCFCLMLILFSSTAFAAEADGEIRFAEVYGLELADGERKQVTFDFPGFSRGISVYNSSTVSEIVQRLCQFVSNAGIVVSYDSASSQFIANYSDGSKAVINVSLDGEVLIPKPSVSIPTVSAPTMTDTLSTISNVMAAVFGWVVAVSNAIVRNSILLLMIVIGFIGTGVALFRRILRL